MEGAVAKPYDKSVEGVAVKTEIHCLTVLDALLYLDGLQQFAEDVGFDHELLWNRLIVFYIYSKVFACLGNVCAFFL